MIAAEACPIEWPEGGLIESTSDAVKAEGPMPPSEVAKWLQEYGLKRP